MKKALLIIMIAAAIVLPLAAAPSLNVSNVTNNGQFGVGLNLGTNLGAAVKWDTSTWDVYANIGAGYIGGGGFHFAAEPGAELKVTEFKIEKAQFDVNAGAMIPVSVSNTGVSVGFLGTGSVSYEFKDFPLQAYLRVGLGINMVFADPFVIGFGYSGAIGGTYMF